VKREEKFLSSDRSWFGWIFYGGDVLVEGDREGGQLRMI